MKAKSTAPEATVNHIEAHLSESLNLTAIATSTHYSKYHLHRQFTSEAGMTVGEYVQRRRLTEAARQLVITNRSILDIALEAGFGSQQAFSAAFKRMFKKTPRQYRLDKEFWPLQNKFELGRMRNVSTISDDLQVRFAKQSDTSQWLVLLDQVVDGYPHLKEGEYRQYLKCAIEQREALVCASDGKLVGALAFRRAAGTIEFLGVLPPLRGGGVSKLLLRAVLGELPSSVTHLSTTTFREGDPADTGWRDELLQLGFFEAELLEEFGYPTQRMVASVSSLKEVCCG